MDLSAFLFQTGVHLSHQVVSSVVKHFTLHSIGLSRTVFLPPSQILVFSVSFKLFFFFKSELHLIMWLQFLVKLSPVPLSLSHLQQVIIFGLLKLFPGSLLLYFKMACLYCHFLFDVHLEYCWLHTLTIRIISCPSPNHHYYTPHLPFTHPLNKFTSHLLISPVFNVFTLKFTEMLFETSHPVFCNYIFMLA